MGKSTRLLCGAGLLAFAAVAMADNAMTTESADLYAGPDNAYPVVAQLDSNTPIQVMGCLDDWSWCDVSVEDTRGWMYSPDITYAYQGGYVPLYSYAPALGVAVVSFSLGEYWGHYYPRQAWYSRRSEWEHRRVEHRRPPGPPPSRAMPPHPEHREAARREDHPVHFNNARPEQQRPEPPRPEEHRDDRHGSAGDSHNFARPNEPHAMPAPSQQHHEAPRPEQHAAPAPNQAQHEAQHEAPHGAPHEGPHEEHARPNNMSHAAPPPPPKHEDNPPH